jgi:hypothetical protein
VHEITANILSGENTLHWRALGCHADAMFAALAADPENLDDFEVALQRYMPPESAAWLMSEACEGFCGAAGKHGLIVIDLDGRLVAKQLRKWIIPRCGEAAWCGIDGASEVFLPYHLADDWLLQKNLKNWQTKAQQRRADRAQAPKFDSRPVIYDRVIDFIVEQWRERPQGDDPIVEIHARWLTTPRDDLHGATPREVLLARREHIDFDLQDQQMRWQTLKTPPVGLSTNSAAFRYAAYGTNEIVLYYSLVRHLLHYCETYFVEPLRIDAQAQKLQLRQIKSQWRDSLEEDLCGYTPQQIADFERSRVPAPVSAEHGMADCDCPLCQMMFEGGPVFFGLDGYEMDDEFVFSLHRTREDWEEINWFRDELNEKVKRDLEQNATTPERRAITNNGPWNCSFGNLSEADLPPGQLRMLQLHRVAGCLAELDLDLKQQSDSADLVRPLNEKFAELREALADQESWIAEMRVQYLIDELDLVAQLRPDLQAKCTDLAEQLDHLLEGSESRG